MLVAHDCISDSCWHAVEGVFVKFAEMVLEIIGRPKGNLQIFIAEPDSTRRNVIRGSYQSNFSEVKTQQTEIVQRH